MRLSRFFIDRDLSPEETIELPSHLVNYIANVLRLKANESIILFNDSSSKQGSSRSRGEYQAALLEVSKRSVIAQVEQFIEKDIESPLKVHLFQGISRSERMDFTIQKAVELGIHCITPVFTQRSNSGKMIAKRLEKKSLHWQGVATSACEQSGRTTQVIINPPIQVQQIREFTAEVNLLLAPDAPENLSELSSLSPHNVNIFIGPEGGLNANEIVWAMDNHYRKINLGPRILRTETAGLATLSILQFLWGDLK